MRKIPNGYDCAHDEQQASDTSYHPRTVGDAHPTGLWGKVRMGGLCISSSAGSPLSHKGRGDLAPSSSSRLQHHPPHPHRRGNVLERVLPHILILQRHPVLDLLIHHL